MEKLVIYLLNILLIALPLALFEILIEKDKGWGSGWNKDKWYARPFYPDSMVSRTLVRILKVQPLLAYHLVVFALFLPFVFILEYFYITHDLILLASCFFAILVLEDFFWFLLNWNFDSRRQLLRGPEGSIWWHKNWLRLGSHTYIPFSYLSGTVLSLLLLALA